MIAKSIIRRHANGWTPNGNRYKRIELTTAQMTALLMEMSALHQPPVEGEYIQQFWG